MNNDQQLNKFFEAARNEAPKTSFDETKTQFIKQTNAMANNQSWFNRLINLKNGFIMLAITGLITAGIILFSGVSKEEIKQELAIQETAITSIDKKEEPKRQLLDPAKTPIQVGKLKQDLSSQPQILASKLVRLEVKEPEYISIDDSYRFPKLTEEQKEAVRKKKEEMVKLILKGKGYSQGKYYNSNEFLFNTEVSNLEYRTFLFDLLMEGRKEDFLKAKPNQKAWGTYTYKDSILQSPYVNLYFSHPAYDNYPLVNVSVTGAEMYCEWLNTIVNQEFQARPENFTKKYIAIKLPSIKDWKAFTGVFKEDSLPFTKENAIEHANYYTGLPITSPLNDHADITTAVNLRKNAQGAANMYGNAAEIVRDGDEYYAVGGSWNDSFENLKLSAKKSLSADFTGSKEVGFRPKITYSTEFYLTDKDDIPSFNDSELKEIEKRKQDLVKNIIKRNGFAGVSDMNAYLSKTELSNRDYKTFLLDLIQSGKYDEYRKYAPNQEGWYMENEGAFMEPMVQQYFSHPAYDNFPVVNVSIEGIRAYVDWLNHLLDKEKGYWNHYKVSLPSKEIWEMALKDGGSSLIPWTDDELALFYINYYNFHEIQVFGSNPEKYLSRELIDKAKSSGLNGPLIYLHTGLVSIGYPNKEGFKNLLGNVSEVVESNGKYIAVGGSWYDTLGTIKKLEERVLPRSFEGSSVVGFRLALMKEGEQETRESGYRFPTITEEEIEFIEKQKKLLIHLSNRKDELETRLAFGNYDTIRNADSVLMNVIPLKTKPLDLNASDSVGLRKYLYNLDYKSTGFLVDNQITNAQYRAFLFDLLIQGRKDDFLVAKPNQDNWKKLEEEPFLFLGFTSNVQDYFSHPYFNDYPVVNVPVKGMELFCEWYSKLLNGASKLKDEFGVDKYYSVELPNNDQWIRTRRSNFNGMYPLKDSLMRIIPVQTASKNNGFFDQENQGKYIHDIGEVILEEGQYHLKAYHWLSGFNAKVLIDSKIPFADELKGSPLVGFRPIIRKVERPLVNHSDDIPELTAKDIKIINENKEELLKNYSKEKGLLFIPLGSMIHDDFNTGKALSVNSFFMSETETSIKDYHTFLLDVVIQGRTEDYLIAKPRIDYQAPRYSWDFYYMGLI